MTGFLTSLRQMRAALLARAEGSLDLWTEELQRERRRLVTLLAWTAGMVFAGAMAALLGTLLALWLVPPPLRVALLATLAGFYLVVFVTLACTLARRLSRPPAPLPVTANLLAVGQLLASAARLVGGSRLTAAAPGTDKTSG